MLVKYANTKIIDKIQDPNKIAAFTQFKNFNKRVANIDPIRLYPDKFLYLRNRSISALETHGANQNADGFPRQEIFNRHSTFIGDPVTVDHTENRVVGMVLDSVWVPKQIFKKSSGLLVAYKPELLEEGDQIVGDWVENILALNKDKANEEHPHLIERVEDGDITDTSMGCFVQYSICSIPGCRHRAANPEEYCKHIAGFKGRAYSGLETNNESVNVYEENYGLTFFEDSIIIPTALGGLAGGEGADPSAKLLEKIASQLDLSPYIVKRAADFTTHGDSTDPNVVEIGGTPESVEEGEQKFDNAEEDSADDLKGADNQVNEILQSLEEQIADLKDMITPDPAKESRFDETGTKAAKKTSLIEIRSNDQNDFKWVMNQLKSINHKVVKSFNEPRNIFLQIEIDKADTYKINKINNKVAGANKDVVLHIISRRNFMKGQPITFMGNVVSVLRQKDLPTIISVAVDKTEVPITNEIMKVLSHLDGDALINFAAKKKMAVSSLNIKLADNDDIPKEGDEVEIPGMVATEPDDSGNIIVSLDVDAETEIEDKMVPVGEISVPEDAVEIEKSDDNEDAAEFVDDPVQLAIDAAKKKATAMPKPPNPKNKVPGAGGNADKSSKERDFSVLQKSHTPNPAKKVPDAGKTSKAGVVELNEDNIQKAIDAVKKKAELPEEMSYDGKPPNDQSKKPEVAAEEDYLGGTHDQSKIPEGVVTQLSTLKKEKASLTTRNAELEKTLTLQEKEIKQLQNGNKILMSRLKPLEVDTVIRNLVRTGQLDKNSVEAQRKELMDLFDSNMPEFRAVSKISSLKAATSTQDRREIKATKNSLNGRNGGLEVDNFLPAAEASTEYRSLDSGEFFE